MLFLLPPDLFLKKLPSVLGACQKQVPEFLRSLFFHNASDMPGQGGKNAVFLKGMASAAETIAVFCGNIGDYFSMATGSDDHQPFHYLHFVTILSGVPRNTSIVADVSEQIPSFFTTALTV